MTGLIGETCSFTCRSASRSSLVMRGLRDSLWRDSSWRLDLSRERERDRLQPPTKGVSPAPSSPQARLRLPETLRGHASHQAARLKSAEPSASQAEEQASSAPPKRTLCR
jgi:hypothetical protein